VRFSRERELYRIRLGDYRIVYAIEDDARLVVEVIQVGHRRDVIRQE
jgi:mRNA interferase RelE/StbE